MITIRKTTLDDVDKVVAFVRLFLAEYPEGSYGFRLDERVIRIVAQRFVNTSFIMNLDRESIGCLIGTITQVPFSDDKIYQEQFWYVLPTSRGLGEKLLDYVEDYCRREGVNKLVMAHSGNNRSPKFEQFYKRRGYQFLEAHYLKGIV